MRTNYYLKPRPPCPYCGHGEGDRGRHIGKSSAGWTFGLRVYPDEGIEGLEDWIPLFERHGVIDEYGDEVTFHRMLATITERSHPHGLLRRHELARHLKVTLPPGATYDLVEGEFS
jgi:hypothetical protein